MARCCRPRLLLGAAALAVLAYGWYTLMLTVLDSDSTGLAPAPSPWADSNTPDKAHLAVALEAHVLDDAAAVAPVEDEAAAAAAPVDGMPGYEPLRASEWRACGDRLLDGTARQHYTPGTAAATPAAVCAHAIPTTT